MRVKGYLFLICMLFILGCKGKGQVVNDNGVMDREIAQQGYDALGPKNMAAPEVTPDQPEAVSEAVSSQPDAPAETFEEKEK